MDNETTLALLRSIILLRHLELDGFEPASFTKVSNILKNARYHHKPVNFDHSYVNPDSLRRLFDKIQYEKAALGSGPGVNGAERRDSELRSFPRKRKISGSNSLAQHENFETSHHLPKLTLKYYGKYRKEVIDRIRGDEKQIVELQREIDLLERGCWGSKSQYQENSKEFGIDVHHALPKPESTGSQELLKDTSRQPTIKREGKLLEQLEEPHGASYIQEENNKTNSTRIHDRGRTIGATDYSNEVVYNAVQDDSNNKRSKLEMHMDIPNSPHQASAIDADQRKKAEGNETTSGLSKSSHTRAESLTYSNSSKIQQILSDNSTDVDNLTSQTNSNAPLQIKYNDALETPSLNKSVIQRTSPANDARINLDEVPAQPPRDNASRSRGQTQVEHLRDVPQEYGRSSSDHRNLSRTPYESGAFSTIPDMRQKPSKATFSPREAIEDQKSHDVQVKDASNIGSNQIVQFPLTPSRADAMAEPPAAQLSKVSPVSPSVGSSNSIERSNRQLHEPSSVTKWRNVEQHSPTSTQPLPRPRSVSPISDHEKAPMSLEPEEKRKVRKAHTISRKSLKGQESHGDELDTHQTRSGLRRGARLRTSSAAASAIPRSSKADKRTPSIASHNDTTSLEDCYPSGKEIKAEPSTPLATESASSQQRFTPELPRTRSRRNAPQPLKLASTSTGRKRRSLREASVPDSTASSVSMPNRGYVAASKSFQRTSAPLMNEIMTHKHASLFSAPVKEKNAEGYRDVIFQPQDLKSIRSAISAGARAVAAAAASAATTTGNAAGNLESIFLSGSPMAPSGSGGGTGTLLLPFSPDLVPPRGIVNSAQLEQELMRMFANAVMFNPGDDGVVRDTREMFEAVAAAVDSWKQAERAAENRGRHMDDDDEVIGTPDEEGRGKRKR